MIIEITKEGAITPITYEKAPPAAPVILSGLLLLAGWPPSPVSFLIFIAFVPLLWLEQQGLTREDFSAWT